MALPEDAVHFVSDDHELAITIPNVALTKMLSLARASDGVETGGIVIGHYGHAGDRVVVTDITRAPRDSDSAPASFVRGIRGLQRLIDRAWRRRRYYVGEWHLHPGGSPAPSPMDIAQMREIANDRKRHCRQPVLIIVGRQAADFDDVNVTIFTPLRCVPVRLAPRSGASPTGSEGR